MGLLGTALSPSHSQQDTGITQLSQWQGGRWWWQQGDKGGSGGKS